VLVPPALLVGAEAAATLADSRAAAGLHLALVALLVGLVVLQALRRAADPSAALALPAAALVGAGAAYAYARLAPVRSFLTVLAPAPLVFLALFLFVSPVGKLVRPSTPEALAAEVSSETPVVMLVFDELATGSLLDERSEIDAARYPNFAALARESTWFRNAATVDAWTVNAVPALLTGTYPEHGRLPVYSEHPNNLFTLLGNRYRLQVSESLTELCPRDLCPHPSEPFASRMDGLFADAGVVYLHRTLPPDLRDGLPSVTGTWGAFLEDATEQNRSRLAGFRAFLSSLGPGARPLLAYAHVMFPHFPWEFLPSGKRYDGDVGEIPGFEGTAWADDDFLVAQAHQRYLLQLGFADRMVGELLARLRASGLYDRALVIVLADHGVSFRPGDRRRAFSETNLEDIAFVPLFVKTPEQGDGRTVDAPVQTVDVLPTIADVLDVDVPWSVEGTSLLAPRARDRYVLVGDRETFRPAVEELLARRSAAVRARSSLFGIGPNRELLGRSVDEFDIAVGVGLSAEVDQTAELSAVDLASGYLPVRLTGRINGGDGPRDLAVVVNGRIEAVARSYLVDAEERLSVLFPESALTTGVNGVALFAVTPQHELVRLWRS
jgi:Sulfatase